ncbi:MAG: hypothetical protein ABIR57_09830 [Aeromicrobium sp.]
MNRIIRNLIVAAPLATAAFAMTPAVAMASEPGPVIVLPADTDPQPGPDDKAPAPKPTKPKGPQDIAPAPKPKGPGDIAPAPKDPKGPNDKAPLPKPKDPKGPGDLTSPKPCPTHGVDCTPDKDEPADGTDSLEVPTRIDAGVADDEQDGIDLTWLLVGGAAVTASGAAFAARNRIRRHG